MILSGWGRFPVVDSNASFLKDTHQLRNLLSHSFNGIAYGMGRSYGDSALAKEVVLTSNFNHFLKLDEFSGILNLQAGATLKDILEVCVPKGWFLPVTPGTQYVTFGGAIASDIHGKNHHKEGSFCDYVKSYRLMLPDGEIKSCSQTQHPDLFHATNGGMGLTGIILDGELQLKKIESAFINKTTIKAKDLDDILSLFDSSIGATYSVAWIDTLAKGSKMGRSLLMLGEHSRDGGLHLSSSKEKSIPIDLPELALHPFNVGLFNMLFYHQHFKRVSHQQVPYLPYFYPLDAILHWNKLYGKKGFIQYQFVLPRTEHHGLKKILEAIAKSNSSSFLAVLKLFGKENKNWLSFPKEGYTLALDFPIRSGLSELIQKLDQLVMDSGGRLYLTKDSMMSKLMFQSGYSNWEKFSELRRTIGADKKFNSLQSIRLGL